MAIDYISSVVVQSNVANSSTTITIPDGATYCQIGVSFWENGGMTSLATTLDGQSATLIRKGSYNSDYETLWVYYVSGFAVGADKTFAWTFNTTPDDGATYMFDFYSGVNLADPYRDHDEVATTSTSVANRTTPAIDSSETDVLSCMVSCFYTAPTWQGGETTAIPADLYNSARYLSGYKAGASPTITSTSAFRQGTIIAVSLKAASGVAYIPYPTSERRGCAGGLQIPRGGLAI